MHSSPESWKSFPPLPPPSPTPTKNCSKVSPTSVPAFAKPRSNAVSASPLPQPLRPNSSRPNSSPPHSSRTNSRRPSSSQAALCPLAALATKLGPSSSELWPFFPPSPSASSLATASDGSAPPYHIPRPLSPSELGQACPERKQNLAWGQPPPAVQPSKTRRPPPQPAPQIHRRQKKRPQKRPRTHFPPPPN